MTKEEMLELLKNVPDGTVLKVYPWQIDNRKLWDLAPGIQIQEGGTFVFLLTK